jgi:hypothetical protein
MPSTWTWKTRNKLSAIGCQQERVGHGLARSNTDRNHLWNPGNLWPDFLVGRRKGFEVQFTINGKEYFLAFAEDERRWYVVAPSSTGVQRIPVYVDAVKWERVMEGQAPSKMSS